MYLPKIIQSLLILCPYLLLGQSTASSNVVTFAIEAPQLDTTRTIRVYLPQEYEITQKHYPVLYMHDAQNLFDTTTAFSGEWKVDEFLDIQKGQKVIVIGIDHGQEKRIKELTPFPHEKYGGGEASAYVDFIRETLKPHVDLSFRTLPGPQNTAIMGSSLGGLVSFYAATKYPDVFGKAGIFSPSFWFSEEIFNFAETSAFEKSSKFYFLGGTSEGEDMVPDILKMKGFLLEKGVEPKGIKVKIVQEGTHNEGFWSSEFPEAFEWLFP